MEEGGTVNGIDPSNLHVMLAEVEEIIIAEEINFTSPLHISGDVTAVNVNNLVLEGLDDCYWRRSAYQDITIPVQLQSAVIEGPVVGETLNGYPLSEYLHKTGQASVFGNNIFEVDARQLASQVVYTDNISRQTLVGNYDIGLLVRGNMDVSSINGINIVELDRSVVKKCGNHRLSEYCSGRICGRPHHLCDVHEIQPSSQGKFCYVSSA
ncbi:uncharacterized protein [Panulirus ornatus]|uniref:uncharacterized protein isoform X2 n=1 Tax=Panulirus ornatus TaxID=150431 RepID=UPI003A8C20F0